MQILSSAFKKKKKKVSNLVVLNKGRPWEACQRHSPPVTNTPVGQTGHSDSAAVPVLGSLSRLAG